MIHDRARGSCSSRTRITNTLEEINMNKRHQRSAGVDENFSSTAALAGTGALLGLRSEAFAAEPPPETGEDSR